MKSFWYSETQACKHLELETTLNETKWFSEKAKSYEDANKYLDIKFQFKVNYKIKK